MGRELYGIAEIADALGLTRQAVTVWRKRGSWGLPNPDVELASGPVWRSVTIEPWLESQRSRLTGGADRPELTGSDVRRGARRLLRLLVLLLEDQHRPALINQALSDIDKYKREVEDAPESDPRRAELTTLMELVPEPNAADPAEFDDLAHRIILKLAELERLLSVDGILHPETDK